MIGIMGGTFDPIHFGHLRIALDVAEACQLTQVRFIPNRVPPHRPQPKASGQQRLAMIEQAIMNEPRFMVDDCELRSAKTSYTVHTLTDLKQLFPAQKLVFIMGLDAFSYFQKWYQWERILQLAHIVVAQRPNYPTSPVQPSTRNTTVPWYHPYLVHSPEAFMQREVGGILFLSVTALAISSTQIREKLSKGNSVRYLLPETVLSYITSQQIY